jgi:hypothetical protein
MKWLLGLPVVLLVGLYVAASVVSDAAMLVDAGVWWMLSLYLVVPALVGIHAWRDR